MNNQPVPQHQWPLPGQGDRVAARIRHVLHAVETQQPFRWKLRQPFVAENRQTAHRLPITKTATDVSPRTLRADRIQFNCPTSIVNRHLPRRFHANGEPGVPFDIFRPADLHLVKQRRQSDPEVNMPRITDTVKHPEPPPLFNHRPLLTVFIDNVLRSPFDPCRQRGEDGSRFRHRNLPNDRKKILVDPGITGSNLANQQLMPSPENAVMMRMILGEVLCQHFTIEPVKWVKVIGSHMRTVVQ